MVRRRFGCLVTLAACLALVPAYADVVFNDTGFNLSGYSYSPTYMTAGASIAVTQCGNCGDGGAGLQFAASFSGSATTTWTAQVAVLNNAFTYAPATQGAIQSITASAYKDLTTNPAEIGGVDVFRPAIQQDGKYYVAAISLPGLTNTTTGFLPVSQSGLVASDFVQYDFTSGSFATGNPNFDGDPMTFGLAQISGLIGSAQLTAVYSNLTFDLVVAPVSPLLTLAPGVLSFDGQANSSEPQQLSIVVGNAGSGSLDFSAAVVSGSPWVSVSPSSGSVPAGGSIAVTVTASTQALSAGNYQDAIHFSAAGRLGSASANVPVTLFVTNAGPILWARPVGAVFNVAQGAGSSATQTLVISNQGSGASTVNWTAAAATGTGVPNGNFLAFGSSGGGDQSGQVQAGSVTSFLLSLNSNASNLGVGVYYELVEISAPGAQNSPQFVTVVLNVAPASVGVQPSITPGGLLFTGAVGQTVAPQQFMVNWSSAQTLVVQSVATAAAGGSWLQVTPVGALVSSASPAVMTVTVGTTGLAAGVYTGTIGLFVPGGVPLGSVSVTLVLSPSTAQAEVRPAVLPKRTGRAQVAVAGCTPSALVLTETGIPNNFSVPAGWPADLIAVMTDDCGNAIDGGSVIASFSNGDAPLSLDDQGTGGQYIGTWQPSNLSSALVTLNGSAGSGTTGALKPAYAKLSGLVTKNQAPVLSPNGILNNLNPLVGGALAPGTVAAAFGTGLTTSANPVSPGTSPLPTEFQNTQLIVGGFVAPLYFLSATQLNVQIPAELAALQQYPAVGVVNGALTLPVTVSVVPTAPGVAANQDGSAIAQHNDFSLITPASPAHPGEPVVIYLIGMGATNPAVASGAAAPGLNPGDTLAQATVQPVLKVSNQTATILYAGLTPGGIGLYQINFEVPSGVAAGNLSLTVSQGGVSANATTLPVAVP